MKIKSPHHGTQCQQPTGCQGFRLLRIAATLGLCVVACTVAQAQSPRSGQAASLLTPSLASSATLSGGTLTHGNENFRVINAGSVLTAADVGDSPSGGVEQVGLLRHGQQMGATIEKTFSRSQGGQCAPCGNYSSLQTNFVDPCGPCDPYWYASIEGLYVQPQVNNRFTLSSNYTLGDYDFEWGPRVTFGSVPDCVNGVEISYVGRLEWIRGAVVNSAGGTLNSILQTDFPLSAADITSFNGATQQSQIYGAEYWSVEINGTAQAWGIAKCVGGVRYIRYDEDFAFVSRTATESGFLLSRIDNNLPGLQVGMDLLYPMCRYGYFDFRSRLVGMINVVDVALQHNNDSVTVLAGEDDKTRIAGMFELAGGMRFQLGEALSIRVGGELWYIDGLATVSRQLRHHTIGAPTITGTSPRDDVLIAGVSFGGEFKY